MKMKGKSLLLWLLVIVIVGVVVTHIGEHLRFRPGAFSGFRHADVCAASIFF